MVRCPHLRLIHLTGSLSRPKKFVLAPDLREYNTIILTKPRANHPYDQVEQKLFGLKNKVVVVLPTDIEKVKADVERRYQEEEEKRLRQRVTRRRHLRTMRMQTYLELVCQNLSLPRGYDEQTEFRNAHIWLRTRALKRAQGYPIEESALGTLDEEMRASCTCMIDAYRECVSMSEITPSTVEQIQEIADLTIRAELKTDLEAELTDLLGDVGRTASWTFAFNVNVSHTFYDWIQFRAILLDLYAKKPTTQQPVIDSLDLTK